MTRNYPKFTTLLAGAALAVTLAASSFGAVKTKPAKAPEVSIKTSMGTIVVVLEPVAAPISTENFLNYVKSGQYNGTLFHRVIDGFMIQGGGFDAKMTEKPAGAPIKNEAKNGLKNKIGTIAMARTGEVDSATDEFFINVADNEFLDHMEVPPQGVDVTRHGQTQHVDAAQADRVYGYAVFGHVVKGMDVVEKIAKLQTTSMGEFQNVPATPVTIESATIIQ